MRHLISIAIAMLVASPAPARSELEKGFIGALRGCEQWVLNPASWAKGPGPFVAAVGLGNKMGLVDQVEAVNLPPEPLRRGNRYWRINSSQGAGYILVVSTQLPMCHITGGGNIDLQPLVESVLASEAFARRWEQIGQDAKGELASTIYRNREDSSFSIVVSRARQPRQRLDRVQVVATATYRTDN